MNTSPAAIITAAALALAAAACSKQPEPSSTQKGITHVYHMRGIITAIGGSPDGQITIHHEAVNDFRNTLDQPEPMNSMTMPFEVAKDVPLGDLKVGDKIAFDWEVNWDAQIHEITAIHKLPADTPLSFGAAATMTMPMTMPMHMNMPMTMPMQMNMPGMSPGTQPGMMH